MSNEVPILSWPELGMVLSRPIDPFTSPIAEIPKKGNRIRHEIAAGIAVPFIVRKLGEKYPVCLLYKPGEGLRVALLEYLETGRREWPGLRNALLWFAIRFIGIPYWHFRGLSRLDLATPSTSTIGNLKGDIIAYKAKYPIKEEPNTVSTGVFQPNPWVERDRVRDAAERGMLSIPEEEPLRTILLDIAMELGTRYMKTGGFVMWKDTWQLERELLLKLNEWAEQRADSSSPVEVVQAIDSTMLAFGKKPVALLPTEEFKEYEFEPWLQEPEI